MIGRTLFCGLLAALAVAQGTIVPIWWPLDVQPNFVLVLLVVWTSINGILAGAVMAGIVGVVLDLMSLDPIGINGLALLSAVLIAGLARQRIFRSALLMPLILTVVAAVVEPFVLAILGGLIGSETMPGRASLPVLLPQALLCAVFVPPLFLLVSWYAHLFPEVHR